MRRFAFSPLNVLLVLLLTAVPQQAFGPSPQVGPGAPGQPVRIPLELFQLPEGLEVTLWAGSPRARQPPGRRP